MKIKNICIVILFILSLVSCTNSNNGSNELITEENKPVIKKVYLSISNYNEYLNINYTSITNGPHYGNYGFNHIMTVNFTSLDDKYSFYNVCITFNKNGGTEFKLSKSGNTTFTLTDYTTTNSVAMKVLVKKISGYVSWTM